MNLVAAIGFLAVWLLASCAGGPATHTLYLRGEKELNPNSDGRSTPVNVRVFQLTDKAKFEEADFDGLWGDETAALGDSLVGAVRAVITATDEDMELPLESRDEVRFIGIVGLFNRVHGPWRRCVSVDEVEDWLFRFREHQILQEER